MVTWNLKEVGGETLVWRTETTYKEYDLPNEDEAQNYSKQVM